MAGPTPSREPVVAQLRSRSETAYTGTVSWRLVNMLSTNHLGLVERGAGRNAQALRETLSMFANMTDATTERRIRGIRAVDSRPVVRRVRERSGVGAARGIEITVTIDERAFEGTGAFLLGAVLDRFFAEYSGFQSFHSDGDPFRRTRRDHAMAAREWERAELCNRRECDGEFFAEFESRAVAVRLLHRVAPSRAHRKGSASHRR